MPDAEPDAGETGDGGLDVGPDAGDGGTTDPAVVAPRMCGEDGQWCWVHGAPIRVIDGTSATALYAGGLGGTFLRWTPAGWRAVPVPAFEDVTDIYVAGPASVWVAAGQLWHFDGADWRAVSGRPRCRALSASGADDVWAYGGCTPRRFDGVEWTEYPLADEGTDLYSILPRGDGEEWARVTDRPFGSEPVFHAHFARFDGAQWRQVGQTFEPIGTDIRYSMIDVDGAVVARVLRNRWMMVFDGERWESADIVVPDAERGQEVVYARRGGFISVDDRCESQRFAFRIEPQLIKLAVQLDDGRRFCTSGLGQMYQQASDGWQRTPYDEFTGTLGPSRWGEVAPQLWAHDAERAWGSGPDNVLRVQTIRAFDAWRGERVSHYDGTRWRTVDELFDYIWDMDGAGEGRAWLVVGSDLKLFDGRDLVDPQIPADIDAVRWHRLHTLPSGETFFTASAGGVSNGSDALVIRHFDGAWSVVRRWSPGSPDYVHFAFGDLVGQTAETLVVAGLSEDDARVVVMRDGDAWRQVPVAGSPWFRSNLFALSTPSLWVDGQERALARLQDEPLDMVPGEVSAGDNYRAPLLWVGPDRIWVVSRNKAMYRRRE